MHKIKNALVLIASTFLLIMVFTPSMAFASCDNPASPAEAVKCGSCDAAGQASCDPGKASKSIDDTISSVINILSVAVGIIAVIMIVVAGFRYITSAGDTAKVASAKSTLVYAIIGLIIVALAQVIVKFVLKNVAK